MSRTFRFTDAAPRTVAGAEVPERSDAVPTMEELVQLTTALDVDVDELNRLMRVNSAVRLTVVLLLSVRRAGKHLRAKDALGLTAGVDFVVEGTGDESDVAPDPPTAPTTDTASGPAGGARHAATPSPTA